MRRLLPGYESASVGGVRDADFLYSFTSSVASVVDGEAQTGPVERRDVVVAGDAEGVYHMFGDRGRDLVSVSGDRRLPEQLLDAAPSPGELPIARASWSAASTTAGGRRDKLPDGSRRQPAPERSELTKRELATSR